MLSASISHPDSACASSGAYQPPSPDPDVTSPTTPLSPASTPASWNARPATSCRRPVGRSAAWWGSNKREFIDWKSGLISKLPTVAYSSFPTHRFKASAPNISSSRYFYSKIHPDILINFWFSFLLQPLQKRLSGEARRGPSPNPGFHLGDEPVRCSRREV